ncbi:VWA domain-containing protein [Streptomyces sp. NPDC048172]|uniref:VWA domain-containing protein n=1 Tax=Streptomyces sp. NPDC048172 TaxID=3365505 RepID=UPI003712FE20
MDETPHGSAGDGAGQHTSVVVADRFDRAAWSETFERSAALRELAQELGARHEHAADLLADVFLAAYKTGPRLRGPEEMAPSRRVQRQVVGALVESADFAVLRRETAGDPYAAAMAVLAQAAAVRRMLERERDDAPQRDPRPAPTPAPASVPAPVRADDDASRTAPAPAPTPAPAAEAPRQAVQASGAPAQPGAPGAVRNAAAPPGPGPEREEVALLRAWGVDPGELERLPYEQRARLAERLRTSRLAQWAELIGRFRQMAGGERARKVENAGGELVGVTLGDDLSRLIPSELANLGLPELRAVFAARYAAGELMLYESQGERPTGQGAVIACVDTSHSMYEAGPGGVTREAWAKGCALALLDQARHARRDFVGILFSAADKVRVFRFPADAPADPLQVLDFAESFLGGGTSYQAPLSAAGALLEEEFNDAARTRGDIVMLTDDECEVTEEWMRGWREAKRALGFRVFGVAIGAPRAAEADSVLDTLCDNLRSVEDLTDVHAAADLFRVI